MNLSKSGNSRGHRVATPPWNKWSYRFVGAGALLLAIAIMMPDAPAPVSAPTIVVVETTVVDITVRNAPDRMRDLSTNLELDLEESYDKLFGGELPFTMTTKEAMQKTGLHAVAPFGKYCILGFGNNPGETVRLVVASRYNNGLTAEMDNVPLHDFDASSEMAYWQGICERGDYTLDERKSWYYAEVKTSA